MPMPHQRGSVPEPNEIIHTWTNEEELLRDLIGLLGTGARAADESFRDLVDFDGADVITYDWSVRDGRGKPLDFPILLVSATRVGE